MSIVNKADWIENRSWDLADEWSKSGKDIASCLDEWREIDANETQYQIALIWCSTNAPHANNAAPMQICIKLAVEAVAARVAGEEADKLETCIVAGCA